MDANSLVQILLQAGLPLGGVIIILVFVLLYPEKVEKWAAMVWFALSTVFKFAHRRAVKLDLEGHLNEYVKRIAKEVPQVADVKVEIELVDGNISRESFFSDGKVILRLRRDDPQDLNFVHGAYLFVSTTLLFQAKRYISPSQREALDLYVTTRVIEKEKPAIVGYFLDTYLHPKLKNPKSKKATYYDKFAHIDQGGLFYPVLIEELDFLGRKVFGRRKDDLIIVEVDDLITFLENIATREVGDDSTDLDFVRDYSRFAVMIIGKRFKLQDSLDPYVNFIRGKLYAEEIETVYVLGKWENREYIYRICDEVSDIYWRYRDRKTVATLRFNDGSTQKVRQIVVILRKKTLSVYQAS